MRAAVTSGAGFIGSDIIGLLSFGQARPAAVIDCIGLVEQRDGAGWLCKRKARE